MTNCKNFIAIDIGGSGSRAKAVFLYQDHQIVIEASSGRIKITDSGINYSHQIIDLISQIKSKYSEEIANSELADDIDSQLLKGTVVSLGASGIMSQRYDRKLIINQITELVHPDKIILLSDAITSATGALNGRSGVSIVAGTGSIIMAGNGKGDWFQVDGWGHLVGDRGSGVSVGIAALRLAAACKDGVINTVEHQEILNVFEKKYGNLTDFIRNIYQMPDRAGKIAEFCVEIDCLALAGNEVACDLLKQAGTQLAESALAAYKNNDIEVDSYFVLSGGVLQSRIVRDSFAKTLQLSVPLAEIVIDSGTPLDGAYYWALKAETEQASLNALCQTKYAYCWYK